jgi:hypothetical protein
MTAAHHDVIIAGLHFMLAEDTQLEQATKSQVTVRARSAHLLPPLGKCRSRNCAV